MMNKWRLKNTLFRVLHPRFWIQIHKTSWEWDAALLRAMESGDIKIIDNYTAKVGPFEVWRANYPFGYGSLYRPEVKLLPSPITRKRLYKLIGEKKTIDEDRLRRAIKMAEL